MNSLTSEHGVQLDWTCLPACLCQRQGGKNEETRRRERESLVPADAHLPLRRDKRASQSFQGITITHPPPFVFYLIFSPQLCGRYKSLELQSWYKARTTVASRAAKCKINVIRGDKDQGAIQAKTSQSVYGDYFVIKHWSPHGQAFF